MVSRDESYSNQRRSTRSTTRINYNESPHDNLMNGTGEKLTRRREEAPQQDDILGKRTRNCRLKGLNSLNESDEEEFEEIYR